MTNEELLKEINSLPAAAKRRVEEFVSRMHSEYSGESVETKTQRSSFKDEPFFGIWADRDDMKDSVAWVRNIRREQWDRRRTNDPS
jgi:hypothetical protein